MALDKDTLKDALEEALNESDAADVAQMMADAIDEYIKGMEISLKVAGKHKKHIKVNQEEIA
jgi:hypothetical protein